MSAAQYRGQVRDGPVYSQGRKFVQQTHRELQVFTLKAGEDFSASDDGDCELSLHLRKIFRGGGYTIEMVDQDRGIHQNCQSYRCHSFRMRR